MLRLFGFGAVAGDPGYQIVCTLKIQWLAIGTFYLVRVVEETVVYWNYEPFLATYYVVTLAAFQLLSVPYLCIESQSC